MDLTFRRIFHPVGHGAFYTEDFSPLPAGRAFRVVYDCGSDTLSPYDFRNIIANISQQNGYLLEVDLLFISHFDNDHINGIDYLIPKRVIIPFLSPGELNLYLAFDKTQEFAKNYLNTIQYCEYSGAQIIYVLPDIYQPDLFEEPIESLNEISISIGEQTNTITRRRLVYIKSGGYIRLEESGKRIWKYQIHKPNANKFASDFFELLKTSNMVWESDISLPIANNLDLNQTNKLVNKFKDLKTIYNKLGEKNLHSLVVFSNKGEGVASVEIKKIIEPSPTT